MRVGLRSLKPEAVHWLRRELQRGALSPAALGRGLCERDQWQNRQGRLCARMLAAEHPLGRIRVPESRLSYLLEANCGQLGVLSFVAAPNRLGTHDAHLGSGVARAGGTWARSSATTAS